MFSGRTLLITGGTGSFGTTVAERFIDTNIGEIRIFSRDEKKQDDMRKKYSSAQLKFYLGDVRSVESLDQAMHGVDFVFHAAALKQVPSCEFFPLEAVRTNVLGTENVLTAAIRAGVRKVICLSTDKAAYPVNAMGISKALMERVYVARSRSVDPQQTLICGTRYGNVLASRGSVVPLFIQQIKSGRPMSLTDPTMTRFLMTLNDAVRLVLYAFERGEAGDLMIQKAPSARMGDLAQAMAQLFGVSADMEVIGTRHGEKKHEVLMTREEAARATDEGDFFRIPADNRDLNYGKFLEDGSPSVSAAKEFSSDGGSILDIDQIQDLLLRVPEVRDALDGWSGSVR